MSNFSLFRMHSASLPIAVAFLCDSGAGYKCHNLLTYLLTYLSFALCSLELGWWLCWRYGLSVPSSSSSTKITYVIATSAKQIISCHPVSLLLDYSICLLAGLQGRIQGRFVGFGRTSPSCSAKTLTAFLGDKVKR